MERGAMMLIGSTESQQDEGILHEFMRLAGDGESRIVVLVDGAESPHYLRKQRAEVWISLGFPSIV